MIEGLRPALNMGPATAPVPPSESMRSETAPRQPEVAPVAPAAAPERAEMQTRHHDTDARDPRHSGAEQDRESREPGDPGYREPRLPQLSAEALATALMDAELPKAIVPRVLPPSAAD